MGDGFGKLGMINPTDPAWLAVRNDSSALADNTLYASNFGGLEPLPPKIDPTDPDWRPTRSFREGTWATNSIDNRGNLAIGVRARNYEWSDEWKKILKIFFRIPRQDNLYPPVDIVRPYTNGVRRDAMRTELGKYYIPYINPDDKEIYFKELPIQPVLPILDSIDNTKGSGPTSFTELADFFETRVNDPAAPPPFLIHRISKFRDDNIGYWQGDDYKTGGDLTWATGIVTDIPSGYLCLGDTYDAMGSTAFYRTLYFDRRIPEVFQNNNQLILYAHHSICYTGGRAWFRQQISGHYTLPFWDVEYNSLSDEIRALYVNTFMYHRGKPFPVMVLRAFFEYTSEKQFWFNDNWIGNLYLTVAIKGYSEVLDIHNNVRFEGWGNNPENDFNRKYLQLDYKDAYNNILSVVTDPLYNINRTIFMGFSRNGVLQHRFMRPFVKKICHPAKFNNNETKNAIPEKFPHLCACVGRDGSNDEINKNNKSYRPMTSPPLKQHCVDKHCNSEKTGVYRWYDRTCEPEVFCTESLGVRAIVDMSLRNIIFDESSPKCQLSSAPTTTTTTTTRPADTTTTPSTTTTTPTNTSALPESFFTMDMTNPVNYDNMKMTDESLYVPFIPSIAYGIAIDQLLYIPVIPKDNTRTAMFESMADLPSLKGNGPTTWGDIGPTLLRLHASKTPLFLTRKLSGTADQPNLPNYSYTNGTSWVPKDYIPVGDCADLQAERRRNSLVLYAHKDICNTDLDMKNSDFVRYPDSENGNQTINAMYIMMGYRYWTGWSKSVIVLRAALKFSIDGALYFDYVWGGKGSVIARATSQRGDAKQFYYANTTGITEWGNHTNSYIPLAFPLHALQHLALLATRPTQDIDDGKFQGFLKADTATPNYDILTLVMRGDAARGDSGLCHPKAFQADEHPILPYILGFPDVCACIGTNGAEDNLNKALENYKSDRTTRIKLKCTNQVCQDFDKDVYRFPDDCPDVQLCIQDVSVKTKVGDLLAENSKVSISDVKQTCNFGGSSSTSTSPPPPPTPSSTNSDVATLPAVATPAVATLPAVATPAVATPAVATLPTDTNPTGANIDAIIGGVFGGIIMIALIVALIYLFVIRRRRAAAQAQ